MKQNIIFYLLLLVCASYSNSQEHLDFQPAHFNSFGLSVGIGGGLENSEDISTVTTNPSIGSLVETVRKPSIQYDIFWEHQWRFKKNNSLLYGAMLSYSSFYCGVRFKNPEYSEYFGAYTGKTNAYILGDLRHSYVSLDFPLAYSHTFNTKIGEFSPAIGLKMKLIAYVPQSGRNYGGISTRTAEINDEDTIYYNEHNLRFGTKSFTPILMPALGVKYSRSLNNGAKLNLHLNYSLFLKALNSIEMYLSNYDNYENGADYLYFSSDYPIEYDSETNEWKGEKQSIYFTLNLSSFNLGLSYTLP